MWCRTVDSGAGDYFIASAMRVAYVISFLGLVIGSVLFAKRTETNSAEILRDGNWNDLCWFCDA
jgi:hypothetical protein